LLALVVVAADLQPLQEQTVALVVQVATQLLALHF
jgi:hypothetical protein